MTLDQVMETIQRSAAADWNVIGVGPTFLTESTYEGMPGDLDLYDVHYHHTRASYRPDVSLGLVWGFPRRGGDEWEEFSFPDRKVTSVFADVVWCGSPIAREIVLVVDGGRCLIPASTHALGHREDGMPVVIGSEVDEFQYELVRLLNELNGVPVSEYESYFNRTGILKGFA